jgi:1-acyl-sn-glycerol-3-phosphate acyltransferase
VIAAGLALDALVLALVPPLAALLTPFFGRRPLRALAAPFVYALRHAIGLVVCLALPREDIRRHYALMRWFVGGVARTALRAARVTVTIDGDEAVIAGSDPVVVLSVHAGEGDSLLVLHTLLNRFGRLPRIVLHHKLRLDPLIDLLGTRLPNVFVDPANGRTEDEIAAMASSLGAHDAVLIFPEGGNFSHERRRRSIAQLRRRGHHRRAAKAERMRNVLAPRPGGALTAIEASGADVVFVGMAGFPAGVGETWRALANPINLRMRLWTVPAAEIPEENRVDWLFGWWRTVDAWVEQNRRP